MSARLPVAQPITDAELEEVRRRLTNPLTILPPLVRSLVARIDALEADAARLKESKPRINAVLDGAEFLLRSVLVNRIVLGDLNGVRLTDSCGAHSHAVTLAEAYHLHAAFDAARVKGGADG